MVTVTLDSYIRLDQCAGIRSVVEHRASQNTRRLLTTFNIINNNAMPLIGVVFEKLVVRLAFLVMIVGIFIRKGENQAIRIVVFDHIALGTGWFAVVTMLYQRISCQRPQAARELLRVMIVDIIVQPKIDVMDVH